MRRRAVSICAAMLTIAVLLGGCAGLGKETQTALQGGAAGPPLGKASAAAGSVVQNERTLTIKATEYRFAPAVIEVSEGTKVNLRLENGGKEQH